MPELLALAPAGARRMSANPVTNGGSLLRDLRLPDWRDYGVPVERHGRTQHEATRVLGAWLRDVTRQKVRICDAGPWWSYAEE